jgi:DNA-binding ferritin-like protein
LRDTFKVAEFGGDQATMDILIGRMEASDKAAWMLRSHLESPSSESMPNV